MKMALKKMVGGLVPDRYFMTRVRGNYGGVFMTFDDGPHPEWTPRSMDALDALNIKATYFLVGQEAERYPEIVKDLVARGHTIGNHTYSHKSLPDLSKAEMDVEVIDNGKRLSDLSGQNVRLFRPPWGRISMGGAAHLMLKGQQIVMWSVDSMDYKKAGVDDIMSQVNSVGLKGGDILLFHDDNTHTIEALAPLAKRVRGGNLTFNNLQNKG